MVKFSRIAVLMTCYNREATTLGCLDSLFRQKIPSGVTLEVFLVDDGSTDGTAQAVRDRYPSVTIIKGDATLFWCGGMRLAFMKAVHLGFDYYWWLNDDTLLFDNAISLLLKTAEEVRRENGRDGVIVGSTIDPVTGKLSYGGSVGRTRWKPLGFKRIDPSDRPIRCDTMNGNCVLIPAAVVEAIGIISDYRHYFGDTDYGLRASDAGFGCWVAPGFIGECRLNIKGDWKNPHKSFLERLRDLYTPKGLPPGEWKRFVKAHTGRAWPYYYIKPWLRVLFPNLRQNEETRPHQGGVAER